MIVSEKRHIVKGIMVRFGVLRSESMLRVVVALAVLVAAGCSGGDGEVVIVDSGSGGALAGDVKPEFVFDAGPGDGVEDESVPVVSRSGTVGEGSDDTGAGQGQPPVPGVLMMAPLGPSMIRARRRRMRCYRGLCGVDQSGDGWGWFGVVA